MRNGQPRVTMHSGAYSINIRKGVVKESQFADIYAFNCVESGDLLAYLAEAPVWHSLIPNPYSAQLAAAPHADMFDIPVFLFDGVPLLRVWQRLSSGLIAPARVAIIRKKRGRVSLRAGIQRRQMGSARIGGEAHV